MHVITSTIPKHTQAVIYMMENIDVLPTGFRFFPTEEELVSFYLLNKLNNTRPEIDRVIPVLDIYNANPFHLPKLGGVYCPEDGDQWFFFIPRQEKEARGGRPNRLTAQGYWKATGSLGDVYSSQNHRVIGRKRTMVFYVGRVPCGEKTPWKMTEYKAIVQSDHDEDDQASIGISRVMEEFSLCRIYKRSKCLREFDRRPSSETMTGDQVALHCCRNEADSSMSGGHTTNLSYRNNNQDVATDTESLWDYNWEELSWFDIYEKKDKSHLRMYYSS